MYMCSLPCLTSTNSIKLRVCFVVDKRLTGLADLYSVHANKVNWGSTRMSVVCQGHPKRTQNSLHFSLMYFLLSPLWSPGLLLNLPDSYLWQVPIYDWSPLPGMKYTHEHFKCAVNNRVMLGFAGESLVTFDLDPSSYSSCCYGHWGEQMQWFELFLSLCVNCVRKALRGHPKLHYN